jgi:hypothetical protein
VINITFGSTLHVNVSGESLTGCKVRRPCFVRNDGFIYSTRKGSDNRVTGEYGRARIMVEKI